MGRKQNERARRNLTGSGTRGQRTRRGFTLIEAIVIIVILGVLMAVIGPRLIGRVGQSKQAVAQTNAASLATATKLFITDHGMPEAGADIKILWTKPSNVTGDYKPYVDSEDALKDPWGNLYILRIPAQHNVDFDIVSYGADGVEGGTEENADIVNGKR
jgi:general secretion pathway protein G